MISGPNSYNGPSREFIREAREFWAWFAAERHRFELMFDMGEAEQIYFDIAPVFSKITKKIRQLSNWEVGPGHKKRFSFSFQIGMLQNKAVVEAFVSYAPEFDSWEINAGRPPKLWDGVFTLGNVSDPERPRLDTNTWSYVLDGFDGGTFFDIGIIAEWPRKPNMDAKARSNAAHLAVEFWVGEVLYLEKFDQVEIMENPTPGDLKRASALPNLKKHLERVQQHFKR